MSRQLRALTGFFTRNPHQPSNSIEKASEDSTLSNDDHRQETILEFLTATTENPVQLYSDAFTQFGTNDFKETFKKIKQIEWRDINDFTKNHILDLIRAQFKKTVQDGGLLVDHTSQPIAAYLNLLEKIIATLPDSFIPQAGIFSGLFEDSKYIKETIPAGKFVSFVTWGMSLSSISKNTLTSILKNLDAEQLYSLILITDSRKEDADLLKKIIFSSGVLRTLIHPYLADDDMSEEHRLILIDKGYIADTSSQAAQESHHTFSSAITVAPSLPGMASLLTAIGVHSANSLNSMASPQSLSDPAEKESVPSLSQSTFI